MGSMFNLFKIDKNMGETIWAPICGILIFVGLAIFAIGYRYDLFGVQTLLEGFKSLFNLT
jgi:hypothetical protein